MKERNQQTRQQTLGREEITDEEIHESRNDDELYRMRRDMLALELGRICGK